MPRRVLSPVVALVLYLSFATIAPADDDLRISIKFVQGLRQRGYFELAGEYLETIGKDPKLPADMKPVVEYELGKNLLENAARTGDLERRKELLDQARGRLESFTKTFPTSPLAADALVQLARLLVERGHLAMLQADEVKVPSEKAAKVAEARGSFVQGRAAYDTALAKLKPIYESFPKFLPPDDPRKDQRELAQTEMLSAQLQRAIVDYEEGETYPSPSEDRTKLMEASLVQFGNIYNDYRSSLAGFYARMWQAKCYMERGDLNPAMGLFNELMAANSGSLRELQRSVGYQRILIMGKRKQYALGADEAVRWLQDNPNHRRTPDGLGVQLELAKNILAQLDEVDRPADKEAAKKRATEALAAVVRDYSAHKAEALELLKQYKPKSALNLNAVANMTYESAMGDADEAIASQDWDRARAVLKVGVKRGDSAHDLDKQNRARYLLSYVDYKTGRFYEAAIMAEHLAKKYRSGGLSPKAVEIAIQSMLEAYNVFTTGDRTRDLERTLALAKYATKTWADTEQGDFGRVVLGEVSFGQGKYPEAITAFESVRSASGRWADAQTRLGAAHWKLSLVYRAKQPPETSAAESEVERALGVLNAAINSRKAGGASLSDPGYVGNACDLADIQLEIGQADKAFTLLSPLVGPLNEAKAPPELKTRVLSNILRAHIGLGEVDKALGDMKEIEAAGGAGASQAQLYYRLGQLLEKELAIREAKNDREGIAKIQASYQKFLEALAGSKTGQSYESLQWAGESMLTIGRAKEAKVVFDRVLSTYENDPAFTGKLGAGDRILRTKLKRVAALRASKEFATASSEISALIEANKRLIEPRVEMAMIAEAKAETGGDWGAASAEWRKLVNQLGTGSGPKPIEYYEAYYHVAYTLWKQKKPAEARQTLARIIKLSPTVGTPAMKAKYEDLLKRIGS